MRVCWKGTTECFNCIDARLEEEEEEESDKTLCQKSGDVFILITLLTIFRSSPFSQVDKNRCSLSARVFQLILLTIVRR